MNAPEPAEPIMLVFHQLLRGLTFTSTNYPPRRFEQLLRWLAEGGVFSARRGRGSAVVLSFDDGYRHLVNVLPPLMEQFNFRPHIFVPTAYIGGFNRWDYSYHLRRIAHLDRSSIRRLVGLGAVLGSHGHTHCELTGLSDSRLATELQWSRATLEDLSGQSVDSVSYPFGRFDKRVIAAAKEAGYKLGYTMRFPRPGGSALARGRVAIYCYDTPFSVLCKLSDSPLRNIERFKAEAANRLSGGTIWLQRLWGRHRG